MQVPILTAPPQPIRRKLLPNQADPDLRGAWLNWQSALDGLGTDYSANGDDLTPVGDPRTEARAGAHFTAASTQYLYRNEADWNIGDSLGAVTAWIKRDSLSGLVQMIFTSSDQASTSAVFAFSVTNDYLEIFIREAAVATAIVRGSTVLLVDQWYHVALISTGSAFLFYVNGVVETMTVLAGADTGEWFADVSNRDNVIIGARRRPAVDKWFDGSILDCRVYGRVPSADEILLMYQAGVPDDSLLLHAFDGSRDLSKYERTLTRIGGVVVGHDMEFDGVDDRIDAGDLGNIQTIMGWVYPETTTEELWLVDAGNDVMVNAGVVTYTGLTPVATYVDGAATTAMVADRWQHLACVIQTVDANNFELGWDGANYGDSKQRHVEVFSTAKAAEFIAQRYARERKFF